MNLTGIFIHIDKCAGTSVNVIVSRHAHLAWMHGDHLMEYQTQPNPPRRIGRVRAQDWERAFKWAFVRNPWDRLVSLWQMVEARAIHQQEQPRSLEDIVKIAESSDLEDFTVPDIEQALSDDPDWHKSQELIKMHLLPYHHPSYHIDELDFVGRFERLKADWKIVRKKLGLRARLPRLNTTRHRHYSAYYDATLRDRVACIYARDIERFGYEFENPGTLRRLFTR